MEEVKVSGKGQKKIMERYINAHGESWIRVKYLDNARTEVILPESEFEKIYGRFC